MTSTSMILRRKSLAASLIVSIRNEYRVFHSSPKKVYNLRVKTPSVHYFKAKWLKLTWSQQDLYSDTYLVHALAGSLRGLQCLETTLKMIVCGCCPGYGSGSLTSNCHMTMPKEKMSLLAWALFSVNISGAWYPGVPKQDPESRSWLKSGLTNLCEQPKSAILHWPEDVTRMFAGLMSKWTIRFSWQCLRPLATWSRKLKTQDFI